MPRFSILALLQATAVVAIFAAAFSTGGDGGTALAFLGAVVAVWCIHLQTGRLNIAGAVVIVLFLTWLSGFLMPTYYPQTRQEVCCHKLKQLGLALLNYDDKHRSLPPVYTVDADGKPLMSWRAQIMADLECSDFLSRYRKDEPWNSPLNRQLTNVSREEFQCPRGFGRGESNNTSYIAIIGQGTAWAPGRSLKLSEITDGTSNTILLVEMKNSGIAWAEPRDLELENLPPGITTQNLLESIAVHPGVINVAFADGSVRSISTAIPWSEFHAMLTIAGGEKIDPTAW